MSSFSPSKRNLREALLFCFNLKKNTTEAHQMLHTAYGDAAPSISTCEFWYRRSKPNIHGKKLMLYIWWDQLGVIYFELLKPNETINGDRYRLQLMRLNRALKEKRSQYEERHEKVILLHDNARPHTAKVVQQYLETLRWEILPPPAIFPRHSPFRLPFVPVDATRLGWAELHDLWGHQKLARFLDRVKRPVVLTPGNPFVARKMG